MLVGRAAETRRLRLALASHRLVGLVGLAGIGKTSLARAIVSGRRRRTVWIGAVHGWTADALAAAAEASLGIVEIAGFRPGLAERGLAIAERLNRSGALLAIDDLHRCLRPADLLAPLVRALDRGRLLYVARRRLPLEPRAEAEGMVIEVGPLDAPSARTLAHRVLEARGGPAESARSLARAARGHPLAIKLAAAGAHKGAGPRLLLASLLEDLEPEDRRVLEELAAHRAPIRAEVPDDLVEQFLVQRTDDGLVVHDLVREALGPFSADAHLRAAKRYRGRATRDPAAAREWVHHLASAGAGEAAAGALERTVLLLSRAREPEIGRLVSAVSRIGRLGPRARIARALHDAFEGRTEEPRLLLRSLSKVGAVPAEARTAYLGAQAYFAYAAGDDAALARAVGAMDPSGARRDPSTYAVSLALWSHRLAERGRTEEALAVVERAAARIRRIPPVLWAARADALWVVGRHEESVAAYRRALAPDLPPRHASAIRRNLAEALLELGRPDEAAREVRAARDLVLPLRTPETEAAVRVREAAVLAATGHAREALRRLDPAIRTLAKTPLFRKLVWRARLDRARVRLRLGDVAGAREDLEIVRAQARRLSARGWAAEADATLADVERVDGDMARARRLCDEGARSATERQTVARLWVVRGRIALDRGRRAEAIDAARRALEVGKDLLPLQAMAWSLAGDARTGPEGLVDLGRAIAAARSAKDPWTESSLRRDRAERALVLGDLTLARADLARAITLSRALGEDVSDLRSRLGRIDFAPPGAIVVDCAARSVQLGGRRVDLSENEVLWRLAELLARSSGRALSKEEVFREVWRRSYRADLHDGNVYVTVRRLRRLLGAALSTLPGGYALVGPVQIVGATAPPRRRWTARQDQILALARGGSISNAQVRRALGVPRRVASRDLAALVAMGKLRRTGVGRGARYASRG